MRIDLQTLTKQLDELSWEEQMAFEMSERHPYPPDEEYQRIEEKIHRLGRRLTPPLLDTLEKEAGYLVWVLRLSPHVPGDDPVRRAERWRHHEDAQVRYWAEQILKESSS